MFATSKSPPDLSLQISPPAETPCITNSTDLTQQNTFNHHNHIYDQPRRLSLGLDMGPFNHHPNITFQPQHYQIYGQDDDFKRRPSRRVRAPRIRWTSTLHDHFIHAVQLLGGHQRATPKSVQELMNVKDLTLAHVKSHLQMYRTVKSTDKGAAGLVADQMQVVSVSPPTALQPQRRSWASSFETNDSHHPMIENTSSDRCLSPFMNDSKAYEVDQVVTLHLPKKMKLSSSIASEKLLNLEFTLGIQHTD